MVEAVEGLVAEIGVLRDALGVRDDYPDVERQSNRAPVHVYAKSLEALHKIRRLQVQLGLAPAAARQMPARTVSAADVLASVEHLTEQVRGIRSELGIEGDVEATPPDAAATLSTAYQRLAVASLMLDGLRGGPLTANDLFQVASAAFHELEVIAEQRQVPLDVRADVPASAKPVDVALDLVRSIQKAIDMQAELGMAASIAPDFTPVRVTSSEIYDLTGTLVAELARIKHHLGIDQASQAVLESSDKTLRDLYARVQQVEQGLDQVADPEAAIAAEDADQQIVEQAPVEPAEVEVAEVPSPPEPQDTEVVDTPADPEPEAAEADVVEMPPLPEPEPDDTEVADTSMEPEPEAPEADVAEVPPLPEPEPDDTEVADASMEPEPETAEVDVADAPSPPGPEEPDGTDLTDASMEPEPETAEVDVAEVPLLPEPGPDDTEVADASMEPDPEAAELDVTEAALPPPDGSEATALPEADPLAVAETESTSSATTCLAVFSGDPQAMGASYPRRGRRDFGDASILVQFEIDENGDTVDGNIEALLDQSTATRERSIGLFVNAAVEAVKAWRFEFEDAQDGQFCEKRQTLSVRVSFSY